MPSNFFGHLKRAPIFSGHPYFRNKIPFCFSLKVRYHELFDKCIAVNHQNHVSFELSLGFFDAFHLFYTYCPDSCAASHYILTTRGT